MRIPALVSDTETRECPRQCSHCKKYYPLASFASVGWRNLANGVRKQYFGRACTLCREKAYLAKQARKQNFKEQ